jgi:hypothetical protein
MAFITPNTPNLVDFTSFIEDSVQIPIAALPVDSPYLGYAFDQALATVITVPGCGWPPGYPPPSPPSNPLGILYTLAVYNLATALLFQITPDQEGQTYFADARSKKPSTNFPNGGFNLNAPALGLVTAASDEGTSGTLKTPDWAAKMTVGDLELFQTPWGRAYLNYAQKFGPSIVGLT